MGKQTLNVFKDQYEAISSTCNMLQTFIMNVQLLNLLPAVTARFKLKCLNVIELISWKKSLSVFTCA